MDSEEFFDYVKEYFGCGKIKSYDDIIQYMSMMCEFGDSLLDERDFANSEFERLNTENFELKKRIKELEQNGKS